MTVFGKTNRLARKSIIVYTRKWLFDTKTLMEIKKKKRVSLEDKALLASNLDDGIFARRHLDVKGNKTIIKRILFSR